jgi:hypothetical protein
MLWLDTILSTPVVGFNFDPALRTAQENLAASRHFLEPKGVLSVGIPQPLDLDVETDNGMAFKITQDVVNVRFTYRPKISNEPGKFPQVEVPPEIVPYTTLLDRSIEETRGFLSAVVSNTRKLVRLGIVASCAVDVDSPPPGVRAFLAHIASPWQEEVPVLTVNIGAVLSRSEKHLDRCLHTLSYTKDAGKSMQVALDWQRVFETPSPLTPAGIMDRVGECKKLALDYFEKFGKGDLEYAAGAEDARE